MKNQDFDTTTAWAAVETRDSRFDGRFVYAVASTGVYCRPSCPSRRPNRKSVSFFPGPEDAERAGYRACRRCRPRSAGPTDPERSVERARAWLDAHPDEPVTLAALGEAVGLSPWYLQRTFKRLTGLTPKEYASARRLERLKTHLRKGDDVTTATYEAGYGSGSRVYEQSDARLGMTPATYRRGGEGTTIRYRIADSPLGRMLVGATGRGICAVTFGASDAELEAGLRREYPNAEIEPGEPREPGEDDALEAWTSAIVHHLEGDAPRLTLPLDVKATAFQWRVWKALQEIPSGETRSYGEIAASLGQPRAARAVARACASNRVALAVPCHRVVRGDGDPGGYRWGEERKRRLLDLEQHRR
ncbi:MAG TPA: bifunctional DNA-binding transcriptional regulator/O6-methylguanine-DNA methyltransferase Ada [Thermoanaerobaculia bacterium]|nr:bifunctional DNA-binding transcriptional regulator/O6-methylguanine-DNA methyltransferase Ada [Thermoanaerobaculia bacterium]